MSQNVDSIFKYTPCLYEIRIGHKSHSRLGWFGGFCMFLQAMEHLQFSLLAF